MPDDVENLRATAQALQERVYRLEARIAELEAERSFVHLYDDLDDPGAEGWRDRCRCGHPRASHWHVSGGEGKCVIEDCTCVDFEERSE